jgi:polysaccharide deacetylase family protein (PEP-CTERM system associated)
MTATTMSASNPPLPEVVRLRSAMTVDVEDYFQVEAFSGIVTRDSWDRTPSRVEANVERILEMLAAESVLATFFTLGWVAERHPTMIRRIVSAGHELASHGYGHARVDRLRPEEFRSDVLHAKQILEDIGRVPIAGYRAPTFSIGHRSPWAFDVLEETGHRYSSSVFPIRHDLYGDPTAPRRPYRPGPGRLWEIPMTTIRLLGHNLPCAGGGYFRLVPYCVYREGLRLFHRREGRAAVFYFHPWEIDPDQPRIEAAGRLSRFRHYLNLDATAGRLQLLLQDFAWGRVDNVFSDIIGI